MKPTRKIHHAVTRVEAAKHTDPEPLGPLWVITICMGLFFAVAALAMMVG